MHRPMFSGSLDDLGFLFATLAAEDGHASQSASSAADGMPRRRVMSSSVAGNGARAARGLRGGGSMFVVSLGPGFFGASFVPDGPGGLPAAGLSIPADASGNPERDAGSFMMQAAMDQALRMMVERSMEEQAHAVSPASELTRDALPRVVVTKADMIDSTNSKCSVCLDEYKPGMRATRMFCGHLFCTSCIREWLRRANSCPVCRFELATDNPNYETGRVQRMEGRKPKLKTGELNVMRIPELKRLMGALGISGAGCVEKADLIRKLISAPTVELCDECDNFLYEDEDLRTLELPFLRTLMERYRLPSLANDDMDEEEERKEILQRFVAAGWLREHRMEEASPDACKLRPQSGKEEALLEKVPQGNETCPSSPAAASLTTCDGIEHSASSLSSLTSPKQEENDETECRTP